MSKSYFKLSQEEVDSLIENQISEISASSTSKFIGIYEIGCGGKSTSKFERMLRTGRIDYYEGSNIEIATVNETRERGLRARLVAADYDQSIDFRELSSRTGVNVIAMFGLPEIVPNAARHYWAQATNLGLKVISYPEIK
jgi:hypothetical protein